MAPADGLARFTSAMIRVGPPRGERAPAKSRTGGAPASRARSSASGRAAASAATSSRFRARMASR